MKPEHINFKLTLNLSTAFQLNTPLTLDGLLSYAIFCEQGLMDEATIEHIPLSCGENGIFKASSLFIPRSTYYVRSSFSRVMSLRGTTVHDFSENRGKGANARYGIIDTQRGKFKTALNSFAAHDARAVVFYAVGDPERTCQLIEDFIPGIGRGASTGAGQIESASWEEMADDFSWVTKDGKPARPLPVDVWSGMSDVVQECAPLSIQIPYLRSAKCTAVFPESLRE